MVVVAFELGNNQGYPSGAYSPDNPAMTSFKDQVAEVWRRSRANWEAESTYVPQHMRASRTERLGDWVSRTVGKIGSIATRFLVSRPVYLEDAPVAPHADFTYGASPAAPVETGEPNVQISEERGPVGVINDWEASVVAGAASINPQVLDAMRATRESIVRPRAS